MSPDEEPERPEPRDGASENDPPWLVIGLGNPGPEYEDTYHNVGFRVVGLLARRHGAKLSLRLGPARIARIGNRTETVLVEPLTYMNRSGAVLPLLFERFGSRARLIVISDDLALPVGKIRIRERGSAGGHNGLKSISSACESDDYLRIRVGIHADRPVSDARDYVLSRVAKSTRETLARAEELAADAVEYIAAEGARPAMSRFNGTDLRENAEKEQNREP